VPSERIEPSSTAYKAVALPSRAGVKYAVPNLAADTSLTGGE
jgi:hypothetical protein